MSIQNDEIQIMFLYQFTMASGNIIQNMNYNNIKCTVSTDISIMPGKMGEFKNKGTAGEVYIE